jgi:hypothetical protein
MVSEKASLDGSLVHHFVNWTRGLTQTSNWCILGSWERKRPKDSTVQRAIKSETFKSKNK